MADENMADPKNPPDYAAFFNEEDKHNCPFVAASNKKSGKSTGFMITKVSDRTNNDDNDSTDELDESRATEDLSSDFLDLSRSVSLDNFGEKPAADLTNVSGGGGGGNCVEMAAGSSLNSVRSEDNFVQQHNMSNGQTRFKVVKVATTEPIRRGRWSCMDFVDPPGRPEVTEKPAGETSNSKETTGSGSSSTASSVHYVQGSDSAADSSAKETGGDPGNAANQNGGSLALPPSAQDSTSEENSSLAQEASDSTSANAANIPVDSIKETLNVDMSSGAPSTDGQSEGEESATSGAGAIDNKIEQAMDLVKSHLMYAVREEVEVLKERISELLEKNQSLEQDLQSMRSDWQRRLEQKDQECLALKQQLDSIKPSQGQGLSPSSPVDLSSPFQFSHQSSVESGGESSQQSQLQPPTGLGLAPSLTDLANSPAEAGEPLTPDGEPPSADQQTPRRESAS